MTAAGNVFALHAPNPDCFSRLVTVGHIPLDTAGHFLARTRRDPAVRLCDDVAARMWSAPHRSLDTALFVARWTTSPSLLTGILSGDTRSSKIRRAALDNQATPLAVIVDVARTDDGSPLSEHAIEVLQSRLGRITVREAVEALADGLPVRVYATVAQRVGVSFADTEPHLNVRWTAGCGKVHATPVSFAELLTTNLSVAAGWSPGELGRLVDACPDPCVAAANLASRNPQLTADPVLSLRFVSLATGPSRPVTGSLPVRAQELAAVLAESPFTSRENLFWLLASVPASNADVAVLVAGHAHADPVWFDALALTDPAGMVAGARQLAGRAEFATPGMWAAACALAESWTGSVGDFVLAARTLLGDRTCTAVAGHGRES